VTINVRSAVKSGDPSTSFNCYTAPAGTLPGDLLLGLHFGLVAGGNTVAGMTGPSGFTQVGSTYADNDCIIKVWKAPGTTATPYTFGGVGIGAAGVLAIDQTNVSTPIHIFPQYNSGTEIDAQIAPSVVPTIPAFLLICGWCCTQGSVPSYSPAWGMTENVDFTDGSTPFTITVNSQVFSDIFSYANQPTGTKCAKPGGTEGSTRYASVTLVVSP
jgi:hypothetical protein